MDIVGIVLALVGFGAAGIIWFEMSKRQKVLQQSLEQAAARSVELESEVQESASRIGELEAELAEAIARRDQKAIAAAMWELELERSYRQWRDVVVPSQASR